MQVIDTKITSKSNGYYFVSFTIHKSSETHHVQARYFEHDVIIDSSTIDLNRREEQVLASHARVEKERLEQQA